MDLFDKARGALGTLRVVIDELSTMKEGHGDRALLIKHVRDSLSEMGFVLSMVYETQGCTLCDGRMYQAQLASDQDSDIWYALLSPCPVCNADGSWWSVERTDNPAVGERVQVARQIPGTHGMNIIEGDPLWCPELEVFRWFVTNDTGRFETPWVTWDTTREGLEVYNSQDLSENANAWSAPYLCPSCSHGCARCGGQGTVRVALTGERAAFGIALSKPQWSTSTTLYLENEFFHSPLEWTPPRSNFGTFSTKVGDIYIRVIPYGDGSYSGVGWVFDHDPNHPRKVTGHARADGLDACLNNICETLIDEGAASYLVEPLVEALTAP